MSDHVATRDALRVVRRSPVLRAKLRPPGRPQHFVERRRLHDLLDELTASQLTLVVAPAGTGKTMLLSGWLATTPTASAWLSLDDADRDGVRLWEGIIAALESLLPNCGEGALRVLRDGSPLTAVVAELLNDLDQAETRAVARRNLIIDDLHVVDGEEEIDSLSVFLMHLPEWLHVVASARREPTLPIDRLRARGQLAEVQFSELRFSRAEAAVMLSLLTPSLTAKEIDETIRRVDGWAAGLQLAALAARSRPADEDEETRRVSRDLLLDQFVRREVLIDVPEDLCESLLEISVVDRVNASFADFLTHRGGTGDQLARPGAHSPFVARLGAGWFEVHTLVRLALYNELARRDQQMLRERHTRAAEWLRDEGGDLQLAVEHWIKADRPREALRLLAGQAPESFAADSKASLEIPAPEETGDLEAMLDYARVQLTVSRGRYIDAIQQASWWFEHGMYDDAMRARLMMGQSGVCLLDGDWIASGQLARQSMSEMGDRWWRYPLGRSGWNMIAREVAYDERWTDTSDAVRDADAALNRDPERLASLEGTRAVGLALAGEPVAALRVAAGVRRVGEESNWSILRAELALAEAVAHRELGDRSRAVSELQALADAPIEPMLVCSVLAMLELVGANLDAGDLDAALAEFQRAASVVERDSLRGGIRHRLAGVGTVLELRRGDAFAARRWAEQVHDPFWGAISMARVELFEDACARALNRLDGAVPRCVRHEVVLDLVRARATDDPDRAIKLLITALDSASSNGMLQTVAAEASGVFELIERVAWRAPAAWMDRLRRLVAAKAMLPGAGDRHQVEHLTDRERDVLRYLPSRLTVREIADELHVSVNTLKFHLKVIYRKLDVTSRAEASEKARELAS